MATIYSRIDCSYTVQAGANFRVLGHCGIYRPKDYIAPMYGVAPKERAAHSNQLR